MRVIRLSVGFVAGLAAAAMLALLMAPSGGFPSRPRFLSIGIGTAAGSNGTITATDAGGLTLQLETGGPLFLLDNAEGALFSIGAAEAVKASRGETLFDAGLVHVAETLKSGADMLVGDTIIIAKTANQSRASDTTFTIDTDLRIASLPAGHYAIDVFLSSTEGGGGFKWRFAAPADARVQGTRACGTLSNIRVTTTDANNCTGGNTVYFFQGGGATTDAVVGGTLGIEWGQDSSNAVATVLESRSWLKVTRLK